MKKRRRHKFAFFDFCFYADLQKERPSCEKHNEHQHIHLDESGQTSTRMWHDGNQTMTSGRGQNLQTPSAKQP